MTGSYVMLDPMGRFFDNVDGRLVYGPAVLDVGVEAAFARVRWERERLVARGRAVCLASVGSKAGMSGDDDRAWSDTALTANDLAHQTIVRDLARRTEAFWHFAARPTFALLVLKTMADGETAITDIPVATSMPPTAVQNARQRLHALDDHLSRDLRADIRRELELDDSTASAA